VLLDVLGAEADDDEVIWDELLVGEEEEELEVVTVLVVVDFDSARNAAAAAIMIMTTTTTAMMTVETARVLFLERFIRRLAPIPVYLYFEPLRMLSSSLGYSWPDFFIEFDFRSLSYGCSPTELNPSCPVPLARMR